MVPSYTSISYAAPAILLSCLAPWVYFSLDLPPTDRLLSPATHQPNDCLPRTVAALCLWFLTLALLRSNLSASRLTGKGSAPLQPLLSTDNASPPADRVCIPRLLHTPLQITVLQIGSALPLPVHALLLFYAFCIACLSHSANKPRGSIPTSRPIGGEKLARWQRRALLHSHHPGRRYQLWKLSLRHTKTACLISAIAASLSMSLGTLITPTALIARYTECLTLNTVTTTTEDPGSPPVPSIPVVTLGMTHLDLDIASGRRAFMDFRHVTLLAEHLADIYRVNLLVCTATNDVFSFGDRDDVASLLPCPVTLTDEHYVCGPPIRPGCANLDAAGLPLTIANPTPGDLGWLTSQARQFADDSNASLLGGGKCPLNHSALDTGGCKGEYTEVALRVHIIATLKRDPDTPTPPKEWLAENHLASCPVCRLPFKLTLFGELRDHKFCLAPPPPRVPAVPASSSSSSSSRAAPATGRAPSSADAARSAIASRAVRCPLTHPGSRSVCSCTRDLSTILTHIRSRYLDNPREAPLPSASWLRDHRCVSCSDCGLPFQPHPSFPNSPFSHVCSAKPGAFTGERSKRPDAPADQLEPSVPRNPIPDASASTPPLPQLEGPSTSPPAQSAGPADHLQLDAQLDLPLPSDALLPLPNAPPPPPDATPLLPDAPLPSPDRPPQLANGVPTATAPPLPEPLNSELESGAFPPSSYTSAAAPVVPLSSMPPALAGRHRHRTAEEKANIKAHVWGIGTATGTSPQLSPTPRIVALRERCFSSPTGLDALIAEIDSEVHLQFQLSPDPPRAPTRMLPEEFPPPDNLPDDPAATPATSSTVGPPPNAGGRSPGVALSCPRQRRRCAPVDHHGNTDSGGSPAITPAHAHQQSPRTACTTMAGPWAHHQQHRRQAPQRQSETGRQSP